MPRRVEVLPVSNYTGGINYMADAFQLGESESTDALNVDFDPNGGFRRRDPVYLINTTALSSTPLNLWTYMTSSSSVKQLIAQRGQTIAHSTGGAFTDLGTGALPWSTAITGTMHAAVANDICYIQRNAEAAPVKWDGTTATALTDAHGTYNDDLAAPAGGEMPKAKYICHHLNYLFHANTVEAGTAQRSRVRFSHPFSDGTGKGAEDYRTNDWIPVGNGDGDEITGMVSFGKELIIFKNNSVWRLRGYGPESFTLDKVSGTVGAVGQKAIVVGAEGVYFYSWPNGLQLYDGSNIKDLWYPLTPITSPQGTGTTVDQLRAARSYSTNTAIGYVDGRVWVSLTVSGGTTNSLTFVYDPRLGKGGGWTRYDTALAAYARYHPPGDDEKWYAVSAATTGYVVQLHETTGGYADTWSATAGTRNTSAVESWLFTRWVDLGNPALKKRWRRPVLVCDSADTAELTVYVYRDYDFRSPARTFDVYIVAETGGYQWGAAPTYVWNGGTWSAATNSAAQTIERGGMLGRGIAIGLKIVGPVAGNVPWNVNSITYKYVPKRIRS